MEALPRAYPVLFAAPEVYEHRLPRGTRVVVELVVRLRWFYG